MNRGRRNLKQAASDQDFTLEECQSIAQVVSLRGSNQIEVKDKRFFLRFHTISPIHSIFFGIFFGWVGLFVCMY